MIETWTATSTLPQSMVQWLKVANNIFTRRNEVAFSPASSLTLACSRRPVLNSVVKRDQRSQSSGASTPAKLYTTRRILLASFVLAAEAFAAWSLRKQHVDLFADCGQAQGCTGRGPLAYRGILTVSFALVGTLLVSL